MRRIVIFLIAAVLVVGGIMYALHVAQKTSNTAVAALLPRDTIAFLHVPDFNRTRNDWHRSDIYRLYTEPAVQDFLRKPLAQAHAQNSISQTAQQIEQLDAKDAFVAVTSMENNLPKVVGGFRFRGSQADVEQIIAGWRANFVGASPKRETIDYQQHKIDICTGFLFTIATVYDGHWFFVANELSELKALLDRADGRLQDRQSLLSTDENFRAAMAEMPTSYALAFYLQPKTLAAKFAPDQQNTLGQIRSISATTRFDNGKIHDVIFVGMPQLSPDAALTRDSVSLGTKDTFLYATSLLNLSKQLAAVYPTAAISPLGSSLQKITNILARANISMDDWHAAFGPELSALADWPSNAHWPSAVVAFPVKDFARAKKLASVFAHASDEDANWNETDRDGVHYLTMQSASVFIVLRPTIAVSDRAMIAGLDPGSVELAIERSRKSSAEFASSQTYKTAASSLPTPKNFFAYVDLATLYSRLDATLRPILMMGAAFMPSMNEHVDLSRIPSADVVTKHLSPIVSSQRYAGGGYITESIGPITLNQTGIAMVALSVMAGQKEGLPSVLSGYGVPSFLSPSPSPKPKRTP